MIKFIRQGVKNIGIQVGIIQPPLISNLLLGKNTKINLRLLPRDSS